MTEMTFHAARLWQQHPREIIAFGALAAAAMVTAAGAAWSSPGLDSFERSTEGSAPPAPPPLLVKQVAPEEALTLNENIPLATGPNPAAKPFSTANVSPVARARALDCLTSAAYYEAGREHEDGIRAVVQVVLNRVRHPAFPSSVCGVVYQGSLRATGAQFTFTNDGSLRRQPDAAGWARARRVAEAALNGFVYAPVGWATHYHANYVLPYWAPTLAKNAVVGAHLFYRWAGGWGRPAAFTQAYARNEPDSTALRGAALAALAARPVEAVAAAVEEQIEEIPGAKVEKSELGRIAIRFDLAKARQATEKLPEQRYVEKVAASDNLRWTLSTGAASSEPPLGRSAPTSSAAAAAAAGSGAGTSR